MVIFVVAGLFLGDGNVTGDKTAVAAVVVTLVETLVTAKGSV